MSEVTLTDCAGWAKILVRAASDGPVARSLGVPHARAASATDGVLTVGWTPGGWLLLSADQPAGRVIERVRARAGGEFTSIVDVTHGHWLGRLTGRSAAAVLATMCAINLADSVTPPGTAFRSLVAAITASVIRDDLDGERSYLVMCDRSYGQYLAYTLTAASRCQ